MNQSVNQESSENQSIKEPINQSRHGKTNARTEATRPLWTFQKSTTRLRPEERRTIQEVSLSRR